MNHNTLVVVGDKFNEFAETENTITLSQLENIIQIPSKVFQKKQQLVAGLGYKQERYTQLLKRLKKNEDTTYHLDTDNFISFIEKNVQSNKHTHQHSEQNILVGRAKKINDSTYELPLIIDERCALMSDHQTGRHVQGVVITEAFRQTFIAVTEEFYLPKDNKETYFVINEMNTQFLGFLFPLPATIRFELVDMDANDFRVKLQAKMTVWQANTLNASMDAKFVVYPARYIRNKEKELSEKALSSYLSDLKIA